MCVHTRKLRPSERKIGVNLHCSLIRIDGCLCFSIEEDATVPKSQAAQICIVSLWIVRRFNCQGLLLVTGELRLQRLCDPFGDLALDAKNVSQLPIIGFGPKMRVIGCFNQLHVHPHRVAALLHASFQDVGNTKLPGDLRQVFRGAFVMPRGCARDHLQISDLR